MTAIAFTEPCPQCGGTGRVKCGKHRACLEHGGWDRCPSCVDGMVPDDATVEAALLDLGKALAMYADPESWFAVAVLYDPPAGEIADDFYHSDELGRAVPGKLAGETLRKYGDLLALAAARHQRGQP